MAAQHSVSLHMMSSRDSSQLGLNELDNALDTHDALVAECAAGRTPFDEFLRQYSNFYWCYALDGHEADDAGRELLRLRADRIELHRQIAEVVLARVVSETDSANPSYTSAGRIGPQAAVELLARLLDQRGSGTNGGAS